MVLVRSLELSSIETGQKIAANSLSVVSASDSPVLATQTTAAAILAKQTSDPATGTLQGTGNTALNSILLKLIAAPATEGLQTALNNLVTALSAKFGAIGQQNKAASVSVVTASDSDQALINKRVLARHTALKFGATGLLTTSGPQTASGIVAPGVGLRLAICKLTVQNASATEQTITLVGDGRSIVAPVKGSGIDWGVGDEFRLPENTAFVPDLAAVAATRVSGKYYIESVTTGAPV